MIPVFSNTLGKEELQAVKEVFASRWLGRGSICKTFERELSAYFGADVLLTNCATSALYIGLRALQLPRGCEIIMPSINFVACASAVLELGFRPVFADVDPHTLNLMPTEIERLRTERTAAVIVLHYGGHPARMDEILDVTGDHIQVIEDAANAVASKYHGKACGTLGMMGIWSFDAMKILVMSDGGALYINSMQRKRAERLRYLGLPLKSKSGTDAAAEGSGRWWEYEVVELSGRFTSNDLLAAIGRVQLRKLPRFINRRLEIWEQYQEGLAGIDWLRRPPEPLEGCTSSYYLYWIQTEHRDRLAAYLYENGVYTTFRYYPLHLVKHFQARCELPGAEYANRFTLNLPMHQNLDDWDVYKIFRLLKEFRP